METYKVVAKIKYKDKFFYVLVNKNCQIYFIKELSDGSIMYPNEKEFIELTEIFNKKQVLAKLDFHKEYKLVPQVIMGNKTLASVLIALTLTSCSVVKAPAGDYEDPNQGSKKTEITYEIPPIEKVLTDGGYEFHSLYNYDNKRIYRIHIMINVDTKTRTIECQNFDEFASYIETKAHPTYDDLIETVNSNPNITGKYKKWILEGLGNLAKNAPDLDLTVLNFNLSRLQLEEKTKEELVQMNDGKEMSGLFDPETGKAYFTKGDDLESSKFIFFHEVLGHGISEASFERDSEPLADRLKMIKRIPVTVKDEDIEKDKIEISTSMTVLKIFGIGNNRFGGNPIVSYVGQGFGEGIADQIAKYALDNENLQSHPYIESSEQFRIMTETVGMNLTEYISQGGAEILSKRMQENDVDDSLQYIIANDAYVTAMKECDIELVNENETFKANVMAFFKDYSDDKIARGNNKAKLVKRLSNILLEGGNYIYSTFSNETINYNAMSQELESIDAAREEQEF